MANTPTRLYNGVSTAPLAHPFQDLPIPDPINCYTFFNDFHTYAAGDWTVTTSAGASAIVAGVGGLLTQTTAATNSDIQGNQLTVAQGALYSGYPMWFKTSLKLSDVSATTSPAVLAGIFAGTIFSQTDGMYFQKTAGTANTVDFIMKSSSTGTSTTVSAVGSLLTTAQTSFAFYFDGKSTPSISIYVNNVKVAVVTDMTNLPPSSAALTTGVGVKNGAAQAVAKVLTTDYIFAAAVSGR